MNDGFRVREEVQAVKESEKFDALKLKGVVKSWLTDLDGNVIPGSMKEESNTIQDGLKEYLAACIGATAVDKKLDNLFDQDYGAGGDAMSASIDDKDGIAYYDHAEYCITATFFTELNAGGTGSQAWIEFYGYITGAINMYGELILGYKITYDTGATSFDTNFAKYTIIQNVDADRKYHFYWKITIG
jgi:hypothetical protein